MKKNICAALVIFTAIALALTGCASNTRQKEHGKATAENTPAVIRVQAPVAPPSIPLVPLMQDEGVKVTWYQKMDEAMSRIMQNEVDVSIIPVNSMAILYNKNVDIQLGAVSTWGILYLVSTDPAIRDWPSLKGKSVAVGARGFSPDLVFRGLLAEQGLKPGEDIKIIYGSSPEIAQMLAADKLSLAVLPEPLLTSVLAKNSRIKIVMNLETEWEKAFPRVKGLPQAGLAVSGKFVREHPEAWREFSDKYEKSLQDYMNNPDKVGSLEEKALNIPPAVINKSLSRSNLKYATAREAREAVNNYLEQIKSIDPEAVGNSIPDKEGNFYLKD